MNLFDSLKERIKEAKNVDNVDDEIKDFYVNVVGVEYFKENVQSLINDINEKNIKLEDEIRLSCKLEDEPNNINDPNAIKVYAKIPKYKTNYHHIGYIPRDLTKECKKFKPYIESSKYYWLLIMKYDIINGIRFNIRIKESKFSK